MNWNALIIIMIISTISVLFRWISFKRVDSIAMELSISSIAYVIISFNTLTHSLYRVLIGIIIVIILSWIHFNYFSKLLNKTKTHIRVMIESVNSQGNKSKEEKKEALEAAIPLAKHAIFLSYVAFIKNGQIRKGKKTASKKYASLLSSIYGETDKCTEEHLCLEKKDQIIGLILFNVLGLLSILNATLDCFFISLIK